MKLEQLIAQIRERQPAALDNIPDRSALRLVRASLAAIRESVEACDEGKVRVMGLGLFNVRKAAAAAGGETKRIVRFVVQKPGGGSKAKVKSA